MFTYLYLLKKLRFLAFDPTKKNVVRMESKLLKLSLNHFYFSLKKKKKTK